MNSYQIQSVKALWYSMKPQNRAEYHIELINRKNKYADIVSNMFNNSLLTAIANNETINEINRIETELKGFMKMYKVGCEALHIWDNLTKREKKNQIIKKKYRFN